MTNKKPKNKLDRLIKDVMAKAEKEKSIVPTLAEISEMVREGLKIIDDEHKERTKNLENTTPEQRYKKAYSIIYNKLSKEEKEIVDAKKENRVLTEFVKRVIVLTEEMESELEKINKK